MNGGICTFFNGQWYSGLNIEHDDSAYSIWFLEDYFKSCGERGVCSNPFGSENWNSSCFKKNRGISF
jgi:hypothetical protein